MTEKLFELLEKNGIRSGPDAFEKIYELDYDQALILAAECFGSIEPTKVEQNNRLFTFAPIASIAGGQYPCNSTECRLESSYSLSLLGALYAERLILPNFFDYMYEYLSGEKEPPQSHPLIERFMHNLASDIAVCFQYKPLFESGIAVMNHTTPTICKNCRNERIKETNAFRLEVEKVLKQTQDKFDLKVRFVYELNEYINIENDDNYLGGQQGWSIAHKLLKAMQKHKNEIPYNLSGKEIYKFGLKDKIIDDVIQDILEYDFYPSLKSATYLTNRQFDIDLIEGTKKLSGLIKSADSLPAFHNIPYLQDILLEDAILLRQREQESFRVYRDALTKFIKLNDSQTAQEFLEAELNPAINTIDNIVKQTQKNYRASAGKKIVFRTVAATAGIAAANLLNIPPQVISNAISVTSILSTPDILDDLGAGKSVPLDAKLHPYYFMWNLRRQHAA